MDLRREEVYHGCLKKMPFTTRALAQQQADITLRTKGDKVYPYYCYNCRLYHNGHRRQRYGRKRTQAADTRRCR